ncbi:MAG: M23 family metallopeptidase [Bergeyella sp.]
MKTKFQYIIILILFFSATPISAQFNTLVRTPSDNGKEKISFAEPVDKSENKKEKKEKSERRKIPRLNSKEELKREIDSLKMILIRYGLSKKQNNFDFKKVEDSIIRIIDEKVKIASSNSKNQFRKMDLIDDIPETSKILMPLNKLNITSGFGTRIHPIFGNKKMHNGVDFQANYEHVYSVLDGIVTEAGWDSKGGGNYIKILHSNRFETSYLHLSHIYYKAGEVVKAGFIIGKSGNTGNSTGPHLHFSVKEFGKFINPIHFLNDLVKANNLIAIYNGQ